jgi:hypothetical protein
MVKGAYSSPEDAATAAADAILGHYQMFDTYRVPDIYDGETVDRGLSEVRQNLKPGDVLPVGTQFDAGLSSQFLAEQTVEALKTQGVWVTNENETGAYLRMPNGNFVARPDGSLFQVMFLDAETKASDIDRSPRFTRSPIAP